MPEVTAIEPQKKKSDRLNIYLDGKFGFGIDAETLVKEKLKVGQEISEERLTTLIRSIEVSKLLEKALRFLSFRPRSEREVRNHLRKKILNSKFLILNSESREGSIQSVIDIIIGRLKKSGYIDDEAFSRWWTEQRRTHRPRGRRLLYQELLQKGIKREIISQAVGQLGSEAAELELAMNAAKKKMSSYKNLEPGEFKQKMGQFLARRGFDWDVIRQVIDTLGKRR